MVPSFPLYIGRYGLDTSSHQCPQNQLLLLPEISDSKLPSSPWGQHREKQRHLRTQTQRTLLTLQLTLHAPPHSNTPSVPKQTLKRIKVKIKVTLPPWCSCEPSRFIPPLVSPRSALRPTLVHGVQTRAKESLYRRHLLLVSHVCLSGHSIPLWKTKGWSVRLW